MFPINEDNLRTAYDYLQMAKEFEKPKEKQDEIKRAIREYIHKEKPFERIIKDDGIDGYVLLLELPSFLESEEDAEEYFEQRYVIHAIP